MPTRKAMNVSMTPELEPSIAARIAAGRYLPASEVVRAALRLLDREELFDGVRSPPEREGSDGHVGPTR